MSTGKSSSETPPPDAGTPRADEALAWLHRSGVERELVAEISQQVRRRRRRRAVAMSALAVTMLAGGVVWRFTALPPTSANEVAVSPSIAAVIVAPRREVLPDGSIAELKEGTEISHDFSGHFRRVNLRRGEAHFQVAKNAERPFVVNAGGVEVRAVGTAFSVQLDQTAVGVLVTEGRVSVEKPSAPHGTPGFSPTPTASGTPGAAAMLEKGHHAVIPLTAEAPAIHQLPEAEMEKRLAWRVPQLELSRTPLGEVLPLVNRHAAARGKKQIVIDAQSAELREMKLSGFLGADNTDGLARLLEINFGVRVEVAGDTITLRKAR